MKEGSKLRKILSKKCNERESLTRVRYLRNNPMKGTRKSGRDTNVTIQSKRILKVRQILTLKSNKKEH